MGIYIGTDNNYYMRYVEGDPVGSPENPFSFADLLAADQLNGWGIISKQGDAYYLSLNGSVLYIRDAVLSEISGLILIGTYREYISCYGAGKIKMGSASSGTYLDNIYLNNSYGDFINIMFSKSRLSMYGTIDRLTTAENLTFINSIQGFIVNSEYVDIKDILMIGSAYSLDVRSDFSASNIKIKDTTYPLFYYISGSREVFISNLKTTNTLNSGVVGVLPGHTIINLIDCQLSPGFGWGKYSTSPGIVTVNIITSLSVLLDVDDAQITLYNKAGEVLLVSNEISNYHLVYHQYEGSHDGVNDVVVVEQQHQPLSIKIERDGYQTKMLTGINVDPGFPTIIRDNLLPNPEPIGFSIKRILSRYFSSGQSITGEESLLEGGLEEELSIVDGVAIVQRDSRLTYNPADNTALIEHLIDSEWLPVELYQDNVHIERISNLVVDDPQPIYINHNVQANVFPTNIIQATVQVTVQIKGNVIL